MFDELCIDTVQEAPRRAITLWDLTHERREELINNMSQTLQRRQYKFEEVDPYSYDLIRQDAVHRLERFEYTQEGVALGFI